MSIPPTASQPNEAEPTGAQPGGAQPNGVGPEYPAPPEAPYSAPHSAQFQAPYEAPAPAPTQSSAKSGSGIVAGIAIGAVLGGLVGGGAAAVIASNMAGQSAVPTTTESSPAINLENLDSVTAITAVAAVATPSVVTLSVSGENAAGSGSGVIYSEDGYILTNAHVATLEGQTADPVIQVQLSDGTLYDGRLIGSDPFADLAVVKIDAEGLTPVAIGDSNEIGVGDLAVVIGAPLNLPNTVTSGVLSALNRGILIASSMLPAEPETEQSEDAPDNPAFPWFQFQSPDEQAQAPQSQSASRVAVPVIQTDASINPGNSGGALLNARGELIGINVALASPTSQSGAAGSDGLGFAIPVNLATRVADSIIAGEQPSHGQLGVVQSVETSTAYQAGGIIGEVNPGSPAEAAGLEAGDIITSVDGAPTDSFVSVTALIRSHAGGSEIVIGYNRAGEQRETTVTLDTLEW